MQNIGAYVALSPDMKLFELIDAYPSLLSIFLRLDIALPKGDMSIEEICQRDGYPSDMFFDIDLSGWKCIRTTDFAGSSHERITEEIYTRND